MKGRVSQLSFWSWALSWSTQFLNYFWTFLDWVAYLWKLSHFFLTKCTSWQEQKGPWKKASLTATWTPQLRGRYCSLEKAESVECSSMPRKRGRIGRGAPVLPLYLQGRECNCKILSAYFAFSIYFLCSACTWEATKRKPFFKKKPKVGWHDVFHSQ